ncbi:MAG: HEPN domain-containing protein [Chloroflexi bacterium]|nr:MAG: HEPN domain-containing protein [Chloroflexota bacterium]
MIFLLRKAELTEIPEKHLEFIGKINNVSIPTRYPDDLQRAIQIYSKPVAEEHLSQTKEILQWLQKHPNLRQDSTEN